jgi:hypothetical protein
MCRISGCCVKKCLGEEIELKSLMNIACVIVLMLGLTGAGFGSERRGDQGFGLSLGNPTGFTGKVWLDNEWAFEGNFGVESGELNIHAELLYHDFKLIKNSKSMSDLFSGLLRRGDVPFYFGLGPKVLFNDEEEVGVRFPIGLGFLPTKSPWEFFAEFAPVVRLTPSFGFNGDYGIGIRYYFKAIRPTENE